MKRIKETKTEAVRGRQPVEPQRGRRSRPEEDDDPSFWRDGEIATEHGVDRLTMWCDATDIAGQRECLMSHCAMHDIRVMSMVGNAKWKMKVEIFQPKPTLYAALQRCLGGRALTLITYVEFAADVIMQRRSHALGAAREFVYLATVPYLRDYVEAYEQTFYYARRAKKGGRRGHALVVYGDKPSKLASPHAGSPALHLEWRTAGSAALSKEGVVTLADLGAFDHKAFWAKKVRFYWIADVMRAADVTLTQFRKWCRRSPQKAEHGLFPKMVVAGQFCMQNFVKERPSILRSVRVNDFERWVKEDISDPPLPG